MNWPMIAFQVAEGLFAAFGFICMISFFVITRKNHCKGLRFKHDRMYVAITKQEDDCDCDDYNHDYEVRWICHRCHEMTEECIGKNGDWKIEQGQLKPDFEKFSKV
jgi:hypothetical protein